MTKIIFLFACLMVASCQAQVIGFGSCPSVIIKQDFQPARYLGKWYEAEKFFAIFQLGGKCVTATYTQNSDTTIGVYNRQINILTNKASTIQGTARLTGGPTEGKLGVLFPSVPFGREAPYWVLETDYDNFAVVYSCTNIGFIKTEFAWILTRQAAPLPNVLSTAYGILDRNGINKSYLLKTNQVNCPTGN